MSKRIHHINARSLAFAVAPMLCFPQHKQQQQALCHHNHHIRRMYRVVSCAVRFVLLWLACFCMKRTHSEALCVLLRESTVYGMEHEAAYIGSISKGNVEAKVKANTKAKAKRERSRVKVLVQNLTELHILTQDEREIAVAAACTAHSTTNNQYFLM